MEVAPVLDEAGAAYWLDFGTLLGIHRQQDLIPYDNDVDLVVVNPDWPALMAALLGAGLGRRYHVEYVHPSEDPTGEPPGLAPAPPTPPGGGIDSAACVRERPPGPRRRPRRRRDRPRPPLAAPPRPPPLAQRRGSASRGTGS